MTYWMGGFKGEREREKEREQPILREDNLHWLDERISEENRGAKGNGDEGPSLKGKGIGGFIHF